KEKPVTGFYAAGECSCVSVHGGNRLGTNSLLEASLFGRRAGKSIVRFLRETRKFPELPADAAKDALAEVERIISADGPEKPGLLREELQEKMMIECGIFRDAEKLGKLENWLKELEARFEKIGIDDRSEKFNYDLLEAIELGHMIEFAELIVAGALRREESRGAHSRTDFPDRDDKKWLKHTLAWKHGGKIDFDYKPVTITRFQPQERKY
ncbi:MAG: FAD-binding protein, partial [Candidatus Krumholzibacteria bacterium]|nr:FAD-binding protein [Candidatus Krumholzibacteria bacterium]